jgi:hypothetical protein
MAKITIGNSNTGYDSAEITFTSTGKARLVQGAVSGRVTVIKKAIAAHNKGETCIVTAAADQVPFSVTK